MSRRYLWIFASVFASASAIIPRWPPVIVLKTGRSVLTSVENADISTNAQLR